MKIVFFGLSISSAWGNGHATLLRGLFRALHDKGHSIDFFEKDVPYYASHRDRTDFPYVTLHLYDCWENVLGAARHELRGADVAVVTSYCADGIAASNLVLNSAVTRKVFYDMDTPVTISQLEQGLSVPYLLSEGLSDFDLVLSYTGGVALQELQDRLGAGFVAPLYGWVDVDSYYQVAADVRFASDLSYLGTFSSDRQRNLEELLLRPAMLMPASRFVIGGAMYPNAKSWPANVKHLDHVPPLDHRAFYSSSPLTLNITRASMAAMGFCPSGRLFEAAACGAAVLSDWWTGLDSFFMPGSEIIIANDSRAAIEAISLDKEILRGVGSRARERTLDCHRAEHRAERLLSLLEQPWRAELGSPSEAVGRTA